MIFKLEPARKGGFFLLIVLEFVFMGGCNKSEAPSTKVVDGSRNKALLAIVESIQMPSRFEMAYMANPKPAADFLSDVLGISEMEIRSRSLTNVLDIYGEPFLLDAIDSIGEGHYDKIALLTDAEATGSAFLSQLADLSNYIALDVLIDMHSDSGGIRFSDRYYPIGEITDAIEAKGIRIRMIYQTCCFGSNMTLFWRGAGVACVNGSVGFNSLTFFSPLIFLKEWVSRRTFSASVDSAYVRELAILDGYQNSYPFLISLYGESVSAQSRQIIVGDADLRFDMVSIHEDALR